MARGERSAHRVEGVGQGDGDAPGVEIVRAGLDVIVMGLKPLMIGGVDAVAEEMHRLGLALEAGGELLGDEDIGIAGDGLGPGDGVVVGDGHEVHASPLGQLVDLFWRRGTFRQRQRALNPQRFDS